MAGSTAPPSPTASSTTTTATTPGLPTPGAHRRLPSFNPSPAPEPQQGALAGRLTKSEERAQGVVSMEVIGAYARALGGVPVFVVLITLYVIIEAVRVAGTVWLSVWTAASDSGSAVHTAIFYLAIFCAISFLQVPPHPNELYEACQ